ncbi:MAG TPA: fibronectin type III-like domain-contianing protein, partial [Pseudacidobacterium sp.]|nr:fibronectin type III-like domain-contianing protein [Pseudacidobacterium sp.]
VLFGDYNPAGRLTQTWVASMDQLPPMMDYDIRHGRTYMYLKTRPLYAFGYGLSYTTFKYSNLRLSSPVLKKAGPITVTVDVTNTGRRAGDEVVQLYVTHLGSKVERPIEELKGFQRISIQPGETKTISLPLKAQDLAYWDEKQHRFIVEDDTVQIRVGASSNDIRLEKALPVKAE